MFADMWPSKRLLCGTLITLLILLQVLLHTNLRSFFRFSYEPINDHRMLVEVSNLTDTQILFGDLTPMDEQSVLQSQHNNVISMSLYGTDPKYLLGAVRNAKVVRQVFPGWRLRVYVGASERFSGGYSTIVHFLMDEGVDVRFVHPALQLAPMMWRFLVADDLTVDNFIIRDVDSLLSKRDYTAVLAWLRSNQTFHCVRDHPSHASFSISGGLWGAKPARLKMLLKNVLWRDKMRRLSTSYLADMTFLQSWVWPAVKSETYCSDSVSCDIWPNSFPFSEARIGDEHLGQVFDLRGVRRKDDIEILKKWPGNPRCLSPQEMPGRKKTGIKVVA